MRRVVRPALLILGLLAVVGCRSGGEATQRPDSLTRRQRDSAIGASRLPGAQGVRRALEASDTAAARRALLDSMARR